MDRDAFRKALAEGKVLRKKPPTGKVNWDSVIRRAVKDGGVYTTTQFWKKFIKGKINRGRTKEKLHELCDKEKLCARIYDTNLRSYIWSFDKEHVKLYHAQQQSASG